MSQEKTHKPLRKRVAEWLSGEGYPLEFRVAEKFREARFQVRQGQYVRDPETHLPREIDVLASRTRSRNRHLARVYNVVECKYSRHKPWVVFTGPSRISPAACIAQTIATDAGHAALWALAGDEGLQNLDVFSSPERPGFGGREAFSKNVDVFYNSMQSVVSLSYLLTQSYDKPPRYPSEALKRAVVAFPVIVLDGTLFEAWFNRDSDELEVRERDRIRLHWRGAERWKMHATVDVVTVHSLSSFTERRSADATRVLAKVQGSVHEMRECIERKDLAPLTVTRAARGVLGMPPLLARIHAELSAEKQKSLEARLPETDA